MSTLLLGGILLTFFLSYPERRVRARPVWLAVWAPMLAAAAPHARYQLSSVYLPLSPLPPDGFRALLFGSFAYLAATAVVVVQSYRALEEGDRRRLRMLVAATLAACVGGVAGVAGYWMGTGELALFHPRLRGRRCSFCRFRPCSRTRSSATGCSI